MHVFFFSVNWENSFWVVRHNHACSGLSAREEHGTPELIPEMGDGVLLVSHGRDLKTDENEDLLQTRLCANECIWQQGLERGRQPRWGRGLVGKGRFWHVAGHVGLVLSSVITLYMQLATIAILGKNKILVFNHHMFLSLQVVQNSYWN